MKLNNFGMLEGKLVTFKTDSTGIVTQVCLQLPTTQKVRLIKCQLSDELLDYNGFSVKLLGWAGDDGFLVQEFQITYNNTRQKKYA